VSTRTGLLVIGRPDGRKVTFPTPDRRLEKAGQDAVAERIAGQPNRWVCTVTSGGREEWPLLPPELREQRTQAEPAAPSTGPAAHGGRTIERSRELSPKRAGIGHMEPRFMGHTGGDIPPAVETAAERVERLQNLPASALGSAWPIALDPAQPNHTQMVTADHCVDGWLNAVMVGGAPGVTVHHDPRGEGNDIAVLDVAKLAKPIPLRTTPVQPGEVVYTIGFPGHLGGLIPREQIITPGRVLRYGPDYIETDAVVKGGTSGGAIVDTQGRIVGLLVEGDESSSGGPSAACLQQTLGVHEPTPAGQVQHHDVTPRRAGVLDLGPSLERGVNSETHVGSTSGPAFAQAYWDVVQYLTPGVHDSAYSFALRATADGKHYDSSQVDWQAHRYEHPEPPPPRPGGSRAGIPPGGAFPEQQPAVPAVQPRSFGIGIGAGVGDVLCGLGDFFVMPFVNWWRPIGGYRPAERIDYGRPVVHQRGQSGGYRAYMERPLGLGWEELPVEVIDADEAARRYPEMFDERER
jgi:Trypsin-like peptidase domain